MPILKSVKRFLFLGPVFFIAAVSAGNNKAPDFEQYPAEQHLEQKPLANIDFSSNLSAKMYQVRLKEGVAKGANFADHYALVSWGCGNECQSLLIVDLKTGKIHSIKDKPEPLLSSRGLDFRLESRLLIVDPPCPENYNPCISHGRSGLPVRYYLMEDKGLRLIVSGT
ncbi:hypothetical protein [Microbulbifer sp. TYP-18]|uniref:hypothetical protein n=1 Tax=Microbulbifer sp. TYP-18 TaxID=3230024 RepID=UPI0034C69966